MEGLNAAHVPQGNTLGFEKHRAYHIPSALCRLGRNRGCLRKEYPGGLLTISKCEEKVNKEILHSTSVELYEDVASGLLPPIHRGMHNMRICLIQTVLRKDPSDEGFK